MFFTEGYQAARIPHDFNLLARKMSLLMHWNIFKNKLASVTIPNLMNLNESQ
jgi:virulence-associated protein VagC